MGKRKYGYIVDSMSGEIQTPDIFSCKYGSLSIIDKLCNINDLRIKVSLGNAFECSFCVYKDTDKEIDENFDNFSDMNAVYIDGFDYFDIKIDLEQSSNIVKKVTGKSLSYSELSNGAKVTMEINTADDMARADYDSSFPTLFYRNPDDYETQEKEKAVKSSLLHRLLTFSPHYQIGHVDKTLWEQFREFSWNNEDFISALSAIQEELKCIFELELKRDDTGGIIKRYIHVYDLEYCQNCYHNAMNNMEPVDTVHHTNSDTQNNNFGQDKINYHNTCNGACLNNETHQIIQFGEVTDIFISTENLTDSITLSSNKDSIKNVFQIKGGDDDITAAVKNINISGDKIICFSNDMLNNMEEDLRKQVVRYQNYVSSFEKEYTDLMNYIYNSYDVILYLQSGKVPYHKKENKKTLEDECCYIAQEMLKNDAVSSQVPSELTEVSSKNIVKSISGFYVGIGYTTKIFCESYDKKYYKWTGTITITDSEDTNIYGIIHFNENNTSVELYGYDSFGNPSTSPIKTIKYSNSLSFSDDFEAYVNYKMKLASQRYDIENDDILMSDSDFNKKINQSGLNKLNAYYAAFSAVMEVLQTTSTTTSPSASLDKYCKEKYEVCFKRCKSIEEKMNVLHEQIGILNHLLKEDETDFIHYWVENVTDILKQIQNSIDVKDDNGNVLVYYDKTQNIKYSDLVNEIIAGYQHYNTTKNEETIENKEFSFLKIKNEIIRATDIKTCLKDLYPLLCSYLKEDVYENSNYVSDGLNNAEILQNAKRLMEKAKRELKNACELQYTISAPLSCLVAYISQNINEIAVEDIYDKFILGNFVHFKIDNKIFRLRLSSIEFDYNSIDKITVEFTDVNMASNNVTDSIKGLLDTMSSISSSYNYTANQAEKSYNTHKEINNIKKEGLDAALININSGINQSVVHDDKGILIRQYDEENDRYMGYQMRLNNGNIALTENNWESIKMAIGKGFYNEKILYGVWADVLVGDLIVGTKLNISNTNGSVNITGNGIEIKNGNIYLENEEYAIEIDPSHPSKNLFSIKEKETNEVVMGIDTDGINRFKGHVYADEGTIGIFTIDKTGISCKKENNNRATVNIYDDGISTSAFLQFSDSNGNDNYEGRSSIELCLGHIWSYVGIDRTNEDGYADNPSRFCSVECYSNALGMKYIGQLHDIDNTGTDKYEILYSMDCVAEKLEINMPIYSNSNAYFNQDLSLKGNINFDGSTTENSSGYTGTLGISYSGYNMIKFTPSIHGTIPITSIGNNASETRLQGYHVELQSEGHIYCNSNYSETAAFMCQTDNDMTIGNPSYRWKTVYSTTGTIQTSDRNAKNSIENLNEDLISKFILSLKPVRFKFNDNDSERYHWGLISQDIEETMIELGMDSKDFAGFIKSPKIIINQDGSEEIVNGEYTYSLRYDEFIAPMIKLMQRQQNRIDELEKTVQKLVQLHA